MNSDPHPSYQGCIKLLDFSLSSIGWRRGLGRGGSSLLVSPLLSPLPARSSQGEDGELDAALPSYGHPLPIGWGKGRGEGKGGQSSSIEVAILPVGLGFLMLLPFGARTTMSDRSGACVAELADKAVRAPGTLFGR